jgi:hypothetical protein
MSPSTTLLLAFEPRSTEVRAVLLAQLQEDFPQMQQIPSSTWASVLECSHVEMYAMRL